MNKRSFPSFFAAAVLVIPTQTKENWQIDQFARIPANRVSFTEQGMVIDVQKSANPLFYSLPSPTVIKGFSIQGEFKGLPRFKDGQQQGSKGADDYPLRLGLVIPGDKKLSGFKKIFAPEWVKNLYKRVPQEIGLDHVHFFNVTQSAQQKGTKRVHPSSDLIQEEFFAAVSQPGPFSYEFNLAQPMTALALWLSIDGDDTQSEYAVKIESLKLLL
jgi:hypothetical protein